MCCVLLLPQLNDEPNKFEENKYKLRVNFNLYVDRIRTTYVGFTCKKKERINQCELG